MTTAVKQPPLVVDLETQPSNLPVAASEANGMNDMIERLASNKDVDVTKLEKIIELKERVLAHDARAAFNAAFSKMQPELPVIDEKGQIKNKDGTVRSKYAKLEDIQAAIKPVLAKYGFGIRHKTVWPDDKKGIIRIVGILTHEFGHSEESVFEAPADKSDFRTEIQSQGSTVSYGRRYTTIDLLNIETRGIDNDGQAPEPPKATAPDGFEKFWTALEDVAAEGIGRLTAVFNGGPEPFKKYLLKNYPREWAKLKTSAEKAGR